MPTWIRERAKHIQANKPDMPESTANPGGLESAKIAFADELSKIALVERLVRIGATDVSGTPRLVMKHRTPDELAQLQQSVSDAWDRGVAPARETAHSIAQYVPTERGKDIAERGMNFLLDNPEQIPLQAVPLPGVSFAALAAKKGLERGLDRIAPLQKAAFLSRGRYLLDQVGKPKVRPEPAGPPNAALKVAALEPKYVLSVGLRDPAVVKVAMFPTSSTPMGSTGMDAQKKLMKSQSVGTPDDKSGIGFKPLNQVGKDAKVPGVPNPIGNNTASFGAKLGTIRVDKIPAGKSPVAALGMDLNDNQRRAIVGGKAVGVDPHVKEAAAIMVKWAFGSTGFGPTGGVFRPRYASYQGQTPIPSPVILDPHIKQSGSGEQPMQKKVAFSQSGYGPANAVAATHGNGGNHSSYLGQVPIPSSVVLDPHIKRAGSVLGKVAGIPLTPQGRLSASSKEGKPKTTGFAGPSIADTAKPIGYGMTLPGAAKNRI